MSVFTVNFDAAESAHSPKRRNEPSGIGMYFWPPVEMSSTSGRTTIQSGCAAFADCSHWAIFSRHCGSRRFRVGFHFRDPAHDLSPSVLLFGCIDRDVRFMRIVQESEHPVILFLLQRIELVVVALRALNGHAEHALPIASMRSNMASMRNCSGSTPPSSLIIELRRKPVATI